MSDEKTAGAQTRVDENRAREWARIAARYAEPDPRRSVLQFFSSIIPLVALWLVMARTVDEAYWLTLLLTPVAAAFLIRLFIIQHDCGHYSFFRSRRINDVLGHLIGVLTLTPHEYWRRAHNIHHATSGNLDKNGIGALDILTVREYLDSTPWRRFLYRMYRYPLVMFGVGPLYLFAIKFRLPLDLLHRQHGALISVMVTNLGIAGLIAGLAWWIGLTEVLLIHTPIIFLASLGGVWLFYIQHQYEETYWRRDSDWNFHEAAIAGSSYYILPQPFRWFTGDLGIHHIHHLSSRIPNYRLNQCLRDNPEMEQVNRIKFLGSLKCLRLTLWDEDSGRMIGFSDIRPEAFPTDSVPNRVETANGSR